MDGLIVTIDGSPLDERCDVAQFTKNGFEWTYEGDSPRQLALAILAHHLNDEKEALAQTDAFMKSVVANLDNDWTLESKDIDVALKEIGNGDS